VTMYVVAIRLTNPTTTISRNSTTAASTPTATLAMSATTTPITATPTVP